MGVYGGMGDTPQGRDKKGTGRWVTGGLVAKTVQEAQEAMGIDWVTRWDRLKEAIPPAYTEWLGRQLYRVVRP